MQEAIEKLKRKITIETTTNMTSEQENYVAGLCDALQILEEVQEDDLKVGKRYFVIMYRDPTNQTNPYIQEMKLYRINNKQKRTYCFTKNLTSNYSCQADLMLYNKGSIKMRVYETYTEAEKAMAYRG